MRKHLTVEEVIYIQEELIKDFGGSFGIRDRKSLEAAVRSIGIDGKSSDESLFCRWK